MAEGLRVGLVGAGVIGQVRAHAVRQAPGFTLVAVADPDATAAARAARGEGVRVCRDYGELVECSDVDVVIVSAPTPLHEPVTVAALAAGKHVLCEKPLAATSAACRRMVDAATRAGRTLAVGFNHRYLPPFRFLKRALDDGRIGRLLHVRARAGHAEFPQFRADWMYVAALSGGGAMMDVGLHMTDLVRFFAGEIEDVQGATVSGIWGAAGSEDDALALMRTRSGVPVAYHATWTEWRGYRFRIEAYGERGMISAQYGPMLNEVVLRGPLGRGRRRVTLHVVANLRHRVFGWLDLARQTFVAELEDLACAIAGERRGLADGVDGLRAVELAEAVYESDRRRTVVHPGSSA